MKIIFTLSILMFIVSVSSACPQSAASVVEVHAPAQEHSALSNPSSCYAVYDGTEQSPRTIMAGYTNESVGSVQVIQRQPDGSFQTVANGPDADEYFEGCRVELADVDGDGKKEVLFTFNVHARIPSGFLYKWDNTSLTNMVEVDNSGDASLADPQLVDIFHDGTLQIAQPGDYPPHQDGTPPDFSGSLLRLQNGKFTLVRDLLWYSTIERKSGSPSGITANFSTSATDRAPYILHVVNGSNSAGDNRASSGHISLNGVEVVGPSQLNQNVAKVDVTVDLKPQNTISVLLDSQPGAKITVWIEGTPLSQK